MPETSKTTRIALHTKTLNEIENALLTARKAELARTNATVKASEYAAIWSGFAEDESYTAALSLRREIALTDLAVLKAPEVAETQAHVTAVKEGATSGACTVFGTISATGGFSGSVRLIGAKGNEIARSNVNSLGNYTIVTECQVDSALLEIRDTNDQLVLQDGRPIPLDQTKVLERNFTLNKCGEIVPDDGGDTTLLMPDLIGNSREEALKLLGTLGEFSISIKEQADDAPAGEVIDQSPAAQTAIDQGTAITLVLSLGQREPVTMPDLKGMKQDEARATLTDYNFQTLGFDFVAAPDHVGLVVKQKPKAGDTLTDSTDILLCIGHATRIMPDLIGMTLEEARQKLIPNIVEKADTVYREADGEVGIVIDHLPKPDQPIGDDGFVRLYVSKAKPTDTITRTVPDVMGKTVTMALRALSTAGIDNPIYDKAKARKRGFRVTAQKPKGGTKLASGKTVTLTFGRPG